MVVKARQLMGKAKACYAVRAVIQRSKGSEIALRSALCLHSLSIYCFAGAKKSKTLPVQNLVSYL